MANLTEEEEVRVVKTVVDRSVEALVEVKARDLVNLGLAEVEVGDLQVLLETALVVGLGNDSNSALSGPSEENLGCGLSVLVGNLLDQVVLEEERSVLGALHVKLVVRRGTEGGVGSDVDVVLLADVDELLLDEVWVVLDLESLGHDLGVAGEVDEGLVAVVGNTNVLGKLLLVERLESSPGLVERSLDGGDLAVLVGPAGRVADAGVNVLDGEREVDDVEVEVVNTLGKSC